MISLEDQIIKLWYDEDYKPDTLPWPSEFADIDFEKVNKLNVKEIRMIQDVIRNNLEEALLSPASYVRRMAELLYREMHDS